MFPFTPVSFAIELIITMNSLCYDLIADTNARTITQEFQFLPILKESFPFSIPLPYKGTIHHLLSDESHSVHGTLWISLSCSISFIKLWFIYLCIYLFIICQLVSEIVPWSCWCGQSESEGHPTRPSVGFSPSQFYQVHTLTDRLANETQRN